MCHPDGRTSEKVSQRKGLTVVRKTLLVSIPTAVLAAVAIAISAADSIGGIEAGTWSAKVERGRNESAEAREKAWIVVNLQLPDGKTVLMTFLTYGAPSTPMSLGDCEGTLDSAKPSLMEHISRQPITAGARLVWAHCVWSADDPIMPLN